MNILMTTWDGGGNVAPMMGAARRLLDHGHRVRVMSDMANDTDVVRSGAAFRSWRRAPNRSNHLPASDPIRDWEAADDLEAFMLMRDRIMCSPARAYAEDVLEELGREAADAVVSSEMLLGAMVAAEVADVPLALFCSNLSLFPIPGLPPMGAGLQPARTTEEKALYASIGAEFGRQLDVGLPAVNEARSALGLDPLMSLSEQTGVAQRVLLATSPCFDFEATHLPPSFRYVGPFLEEPEWIAEALAPVPNDDPLVLVAFSSTFQDQMGPISRVCAAMADLPVRSVVTLGPALAGARLSAPPNVAVVAAASHEALMREAAAVVTHAGHGTVIRALNQGVPLLCLPMGRDQHDNAVRVEVHGAGLRLDRTASSEAIRAALQRLLDEPSFKAGAARLSADIRVGTGTSDLVTEIEGLAHTRHQTASLLRMAN